MENGESNNGKFLNNLAKYGGWIVAVAAFGWTVGNVANNKADASDIKALQAQINEAINTNGIQDTKIGTIDDNLKEINKKLDQILGWRK